MSQIRAKNAVVFGITGDDAETLRRFSAVEGLNFPLLVDPDRSLARIYGTLGKDNLPARLTVIVGSDGRILAIDRSVSDQFVRQGEDLVSRHGQNVRLWLTGWEGRPGSQVPTFWLPSLGGGTLSIVKARSRATVLIFLTSRCPISVQYTGTLGSVLRRYREQEVSFVGIVSEKEGTSVELGSTLKKNRLELPIGLDATGEIARRFGATVTPTVWVVDADQKVRYRGGLDLPNAGQSARLLHEALNSVLTGRSVSIPESPAIGTPIGG